MTLHNHNGTLVIHNPEGEYDYQALVEEWKDKKDELLDLPIDLEEYKADLCSQIEARKEPIMLAGFDYNGKTVRADSEAQANLTAWIVRDGRAVSRTRKIGSCLTVTFCRSTAQRNLTHWPMLSRISRKKSIQPLLQARLRSWHLVACPVLRRPLMPGKMA